jgi:hypothetical protein
MVTPSWLKDFLVGAALLQESNLNLNPREVALFTG